MFNSIYWKISVPSNGENGAVRHELAHATKKEKYFITLAVVTFTRQSSASAKGRIENKNSNSVYFKKKSPIRRGKPSTAPFG